MKPATPSATKPATTPSTTPAAGKGGHKPAPTTAPSVAVGDTIYYRHKTHGITHGMVAAVGRHGVTTDADGESHKVAWGQYLGHRKRATKRLTIVDRGEDGSIMEDENGQRVYVHGSLDEYLPEDGGALAKSMLPEGHPDSLLIDIGDLHGDACDCALETLHKAMAEEPSDQAVWRPHENPFLTALVEQITDDGLTALRAAQADLLFVIDPDPISKGLWDLTGMAAMRKRLDKPASQYTASDWVDLVDLIFHTRLPQAVQATLAASIRAKSALAGKLQALFDRGAHALGALVAAMGRVVAGTSEPPPATLFQIPRAAAAEQDAVMDLAEARIGVNMRAMTDGARAKISRTILAHVQAHGTGHTGLLQQKLFDNFGELNRDWRRIAVTEAGEVANQAYLSQFPAGTKVKRIEMYQGACPFCRKINGMVFEWDDLPHQDSSGWTYIWPGKTNVGRSSSPRKRTEDGLVERLPSELWWPAAGVQHPNCRGRWEAQPSKVLPPGVDPKFAAWLDKELEK